jgi:hypothetical protein
MKRYYLILLVFFTSIIFGMCSKSDNNFWESEMQTSLYTDFPNGKDYAHKGFSELELAKIISNDPDWIEYKKTSQELLVFLIKKNINLYDLRYFDKHFFYSQIGKDSVFYDSKFQIGKKHAFNIYKKYFADVKICTPCYELSLDKKLAYAKLFEKIKLSKEMNQRSLQNEGGGDVPKAPNCWNLQFFACGGLCAMTMEAPPAFALCMGYCIAQHCK